MQPSIYRVGDRAKLLVISTDRFKSEYFSMQFAVPLSEETTQSFSMITRLLRCGTERYTTKAAFDRQMDDLYASSISATTRKLGDTQLLRFAADFLGARYVGGGLGLLPQVLSMMHELLYCSYLPNGCFHAPYLEAEKLYFKDTVRSEINHPRSLAKQRCMSLLLGGEAHALPLLGTEETVDQLQAAALTALWQSAVQRLTPIFCYVGNSAPQAVVELLEQHFRIGDEPLVGVTPCNQMPQSVRRVDEAMPISQGRLVIGYRTDITPADPLFAASQLAEVIYGGSAGSKLFLNVREKRSLCYYCSSSYNATKGYMLAECGIKPSNRELAESAIREELLAICRGEVSDQELHAAKMFMDHTYQKLYDSPSALADFYVRLALEGREECVEGRRAAFRAVTKEQVIAAARHFCEGAVFFLDGTVASEVEEDE